MTPLDVFNPVNLSDASRLTGPAGARALLDAARSFPGGPAMLVFALFWSPVGPGIPAGVLLARHIPLSPPITFALYAASDLLGALVCYPLFTALRRHARRVRPLHWIGTRMLRLAMLGTRVPRAAEVPAELGRRGVGPALFRIATVGFGVDVYSAGMVATGLPVPRALIRREVAEREGNEVETTGDGFLARFDSPARALECARVVRDDIKRLGIEIRAGIHTGECDLQGGKLSGIAVHIAARVQAAANPGQILVSATVKDLAIGSAIRFEDRGEHSLKGVPGEWRLYSLVG